MKDFAKKYWWTGLIVELILVILIFVLPIATQTVTVLGTDVTVEVKLMEMLTGSITREGVTSAFKVAPVFYVFLLLGVVGIQATISLYAIGNGKTGKIKMTMVLAAVSFLTVLIFVFMGSKSFFDASETSDAVKYGLGSAAYMMLIASAATMGICGKALADGE